MRINQFDFAPPTDESSVKELQYGMCFQLTGLPNHPLFGHEAASLFLPALPNTRYDDPDLIESVFDGLHYVVANYFPTLKISRDPGDYRWFDLGVRLHDWVGEHAAPAMREPIQTWELAARPNSWTWEPIQ